MRRRAALWSAVAAGAAAVAVARTFLLVVRVDGTSMAPTFGPGEAVLAVRRRRSSAVRRNDIVVCRLPAGVPGPDSLVIKRVTGVAGDELAGGGGVVPPGRLFVCGDGPGSYDSRQFGPIPVGNVVGHVVARLSLGGEPAA
jgi:signal peptidase I